MAAVIRIHDPPFIIQYGDFYSSGPHIESNTGNIHRFDSSYMARARISSKIPENCLRFLPRLLGGVPILEGKSY